MNERFSFIVNMAVPFALALAGCRCTRGGEAAARTSHIDPAGPDASMQVGPAAPGEARRVDPAFAQPLIERAKAPERLRLSDWDAAVDAASAIRARVELLRAGVLSAEDVRLVRARADDAAAWVLRSEAVGELGRRFGKAGPTGVRGWGTSRPIQIGPIVMDVAIDAYSTGTTLGGLADLAEYATEQGDRTSAARLFGEVAAIADHWLESRMFDVPGGGRSWEKIATLDPRVHRFVIVNTDAIFARDFMVLSSVGRWLGDSLRAASYEHIAIAVGRRIRDSLVASIIDAGGRAHADKWVYGFEVTGDGQLAPQRIEDANHASFTLDFISQASLRDLGASEGAPVFSRGDVAALGALLGEAVFVRTPDGEPAYSVFVDPGDIVREGTRAKRRVSGFSFAPTANRPMRVTSWWQQLAGASRSLDLGLSIRTSWGWSQAVRDDAVLLEQLGKYLASESEANSGDRAANVFLSQAVWLRVSGLHTGRAAAPSR